MDNNFWDRSCPWTSTCLCPLPYRCHEWGFSLLSIFFSLLSVSLLWLPACSLTSYTPIALWMVDSFLWKTLTPVLSLFINIIVTNNVIIWLALREVSSSGVIAHKFLPVYPFARIIHMLPFLKIPTRNVGNLTNFDWAAPGQIEHLGKNFCISCNCASLNTLVTKF